MTGVLFDMDGVLVDTEGLWYRAYSEVLAEFGVSVTREVYAREWVSLGHGAEWACSRFPSITITPEEMKRRRAPIVRRLVLEEARLMPGVVPALERLSARFPLALATNSSAEIVLPLFEKHGLAGYFEGRLVTKECYAKPKPAPDAFLAAAAALALPPSRCVVIEDAQKGVTAAHAAGARCIAVPNWWTEDNDFSTADRVLASLDEVTPDTIETVLAESPTTIRPAQPADRAAIQAIFRAAVRAEGPSAYDATQVDAWAEGIDPAYPPDGAQVLVAEDADGVHAFAEWRPATREVHMLYVHPRRARRALGTRLLSAVEHGARESGVAEAHLTSSMNALTFYERRGWERVSEESRCPRGGGPMRCVRMRKLFRGG